MIVLTVTKNASSTLSHVKYKQFISSNYDEIIIKAIAKNTNDQEHSS